MPLIFPFRATVSPSGQRRRLLMAVLALLVSPPPLFAQPPPSLMLAGRWHEELDARAYLVSEKLDGMCPT